MRTPLAGKILDPIITTLPELAVGAVVSKVRREQTSRLERMVDQAIRDFEE